MLLVITSFVIVPSLFYFQYRNFDNFWLPFESSSVSYFLENALFPNHLQAGIKDIFLYTPYGVSTGIDSVNGSLWTLPLEIRCYLMIYLFTRIPIEKYRRRLLMLFSIILLAFLFTFSIVNLEIGPWVLLALHLVLFFLFGALTSEYNLSCRKFFLFALSIFIMGLIMPSSRNDLLIYPFALILGLASILIIPKM